MDKLFDQQEQAAAIESQRPVETPKVWVKPPPDDPPAIPANLSRVEPQALAVVQAPVNIGEIMRSAIASGRPMSEFKEALDLAERLEAIRRESLFNTAFTAFKRSCPPIARRTQDEYITVTRKGVRKPRMYASLDDISATCDPHLHANGLTYDWTSAEVTPGWSIVRRFILRHEAGHSRFPVASPPIPIEGGADYKAIDSARKPTSASPQQRMGIADTYAKRYSMTSGMGIPTADEDDESVMAQAANLAVIIDENQQRTINDLLLSSGADKARFLAWCGKGITKISEIPASKFDAACDILNQKIKAGGK